MNRESVKYIHGDRRPFECPLVVWWQDRSGESKVVRAKCLDLSPQGARILSAHPMDVRTNVYVQSPSHGQLGSATVRHCSHSGVKYNIGLMFSSASSQADEGRKRCIEAILADTEKEPHAV